MSSSAAASIQFGEVPASLPNPQLTNPLLDVGADGTVLMRFPEARILIARGEEIVVAPAAERGHGEELAAALEPLLMPAALSFLLHQRKTIMPLRASVVSVDGEAVALLGNPGLGKSTLAAALIQRGARLLSEDLAVVRPGAQGLEALPGPQRLSIWPDSLKHLGIDVEQTTSLRAHTPVRSWAPDVATQPQRLRMSILLRASGDTQEIRFENVASRTYLMAAATIGYMQPLVQLFRGTPAQFITLTGLATHVPLWRLERSIHPLDSKGDIERCADLILAHLKDAPAETATEGN